jgi:hypothetical protein
VAALAGGLLSGAFDALRDWWSRPVLQLDYQPEAGSRATSTYIERDVSVEEIFIKVRLRNTGRKVARDCRVFLTKIREFTDGNFHETPYFDSKPLRWPGYPDDFAPRNVPKGIDSFIDVVGVRKDMSDWRFKVESLYANQQSLKTFKGTYRLTIVATADNANPTSFEIDVTYNGDWHSLRATAHG